VGNNPANKTDPSGLIAREALALAAGLGGAISSGWSASVAAFQNESLGDMALKSLEGINPTAGAAVSAGVKLAGAAKEARALAGPVFKTTKEATAAAEVLGFKRIGETVNGQAVYQQGKRFITRDVDGHNGGAWKMADSVNNLASKDTRLGTFSQDLTRIGD
jgi:hypothetical protein